MCVRACVRVCVCVCDTHNFSNYVLLASINKSCNFVKHSFSEMYVKFQLWGHGLFLRFETWYRKLEFGMCVLFKAKTLSNYFLLAPINTIYKY